MLKMSQVNYIRDLHNSGYRISKISDETGADPKTIRKYIKKDDFSQKPPKKTTHPSILDGYKKTINEWLDEDKKSWYKQQHTAKRIYDRLVDECGYKGSYSVVQRYVKKMREITIWSKLILFRCFNQAKNYVASFSSIIDFYNSRRFW